MIGARRDRYLSPKRAKRRLRWLLLLFVIALCPPVYLLLDTVYSQLENEAYFQHRARAEQLVDRIERRLFEGIKAEQNRPIAEYSFFNVLENPLLESAAVKFSPLSVFPPDTHVPGLVGYFQINPDGSFQIPALPEIRDDRSGLSTEELTARIALRDRLYRLLTLPPSPRKPKPGTRQDSDSREDRAQQTASRLPKTEYRLDDLASFAERDASEAVDGVAVNKQAADNKGRPKPQETSQPLSERVLRSLNIDDSKWKEKNKQGVADSVEGRRITIPSPYAVRKEIVKLPDQSIAGAAFKRSTSQKMRSASTEETETPAKIMRKKAPQQPSRTRTIEQRPIAILSFESEVSPLRLRLLNNAYACFYRQAWSLDGRYLQGFLVATQAFFDATVRPLTEAMQGGRLSSVLIAYDGKLLQQYKMAALQSESLLFRRSLRQPFQQLEIIVNSGPLSAGSGAWVIDGLAVSFILILSIGMFGFYRLGSRQIELAGQQRNFISAVSHELKTPLTSIRMYGEMLRCGWIADETRKKTYYDYIVFESERLARLIGNVLQLARFENHSKTVDWVSVAPDRLLQTIIDKVAAQIEASQFQLHVVPAGPMPKGVTVKIEEDAVCQVMINLIDNAIKFSADSVHKTIDIGLKIPKNGQEAVYFVRDYGAGIDKKHLKKVFRLFYRAEDELTRTKAGTGIGLALVAQLAERMHATVHVQNRQPGVEVQLIFKLFSS